MGIGDQIDRAALAAVAAVGTAARDELFAAEAERARAAVAGRDVDVDFVDEHVSQSGTRNHEIGADLAARPARFLCDLLDGEDADEAAARAVIFEPHPAGDLREERVVLAEADVEPGLEPAAALPDENRSAGHDVAVVALDAEALRVAVAAVARAALSFFM